MTGQNLIRWGSVVLFAGVGIALGTAGGCSSSDEAAPPAATGGSGGAGGSDGGAKTDAKPEAGKGGSSGDGAKPDRSGNYDITACPGVTPMPPAMIDQAATCNSTCGKSHCIPASYLDSATTGNAAIPDCDDGMGGTGKCLPDKITEVNGAFVLKKCSSSVAAKDGVCLPYCFLISSGYQDVLQQDDCAGDDSRCTPCTDQTGADNGSCVDHCAAAGDAGHEGGDAATSDATTEASTSDATTSDATTEASTDAAAE